MVNDEGERTEASEFEFIQNAKTKLHHFTQQMSSRLKEGQRALQHKVMLTSQNIRNKRKVLRNFADRPRALMRQTITGDSSKKIRDHVKEKTAKQRERVREKLHEPPVVRFFDKTGFLLGVVGLSSTLWIFARYPFHFWQWYCAVIPPMICLRYYMYRRQKWQYFLIDFCYFAQVSLLCNLFLFPHCAWLWKANYVISHGPLLWAILTWRNSFVFHCLDKVTSIFIHGFPPLLTYCIRWHPSSDESIQLQKMFTMCSLNSSTSCTLTISFILCIPVLLYLLWQTLYILKTELLDREKLSKDPMLVTSIRWLSEDNSNIMNRFTLALCRKCCLFGKTETFNADTWKTKIVFWVAQLVYTILTLVPTYFTFHNIYFDGTLLWIMFLISVWNGANYYIDIFSRKYVLKFASSNSTAVGTSVSTVPSVTTTTVPKRRSSLCELTLQPTSIPTPASDSVIISDINDACSPLTYYSSFASGNEDTPSTTTSAPVLNGNFHEDWTSPVFEKRA